VCSLTGRHGAYSETATATATDYGLNAADAGSSFVFDGQVWWLFGNSNATATFGSLPNKSMRFPAIKTSLVSDSMATSSLDT
jgi:hypothetical protein